MVTSASRRKRLGATSIAMAGLVALTACSGPTDEPGAGESKSITIGMNAGLVSSFEEYAEAFMSERDGWTVKVEPVPDAQADYIQQLVTQGLSGTMPDLVFNYDSLNQTLASNQLLLDLAPRLEEGNGGLERDAFLPNFLEQYLVGDQITALPVSADSTMLFYNEDLLSKYGVDVPSADWTLDDLYSAAEEITAASGGDVYGLITPIGDGTAPFGYYPTLRAFGSNLYDKEKGEFVFADDAGLRAWEMLLRPYVDGFGTPYDRNPDAQKLFVSGQAAMRLDTRPGVTVMRDAMTESWNVQQLPMVDGKSTTGGGSYSLSISAKSKNQEAAWEFLTWFYQTDGGMLIAQENGVLPPTVDGLQNGTWKQDSNSVPSNLVAVTEYAVENALLTDPVPDAAQPRVAPVLADALQKVVLNGVSVKDAYTAAQEELNALL